jgi:hypothetical protein
LAGDTRSIFSAVKAAGGTADALYLGGADGTLGSVEQGKLVPVASSNSNAITGVALSQGYGLAVGVSGTVLRSEDAGQHWSSVTGDSVAQTQAQ